MIVGGLAVQILAAQQFKKYFRPTIDADILVETEPFKTFKEKLDGIAKTSKTKFGLGYHIRNGHFANIIELIQEKPLNQKNVFLLSFTRHQPELYSRIKTQVKQKLEFDFERINLESIGITPNLIQTKAKINSTTNQFINTERIEFLLENKYNRILKKKQIPTEINPYFEKLRLKIIQTGIQYHTGQEMDFIQEETHKMYFKDLNQYNILKDIYDFCLLKKIE